MADSRILHRSAGGSEKIARLSDLEFRVWTQYVLSADDFGIMAASAFVLQADNRGLRQRQTKQIQKALEAVIAAGLIIAFVHQGERYVWQPDWQDWQGIRYPRASVSPLPSDLSVATPKTRELFGKHTASSPQDFGEVSETLRSYAGAGMRETLTPTPTPTPAPTRTQVGESEKRADFGQSITGAHRTHGWCNQRGLCVPKVLYDELLQRVGVERQAELRAWMGTIIDGLGPTVPGETVWVFWRSRFEAWHGVSSAKAEPAARPELGSWRDECERVHGGHAGDYCGNQTMHRARMLNGQQVPA